MLCRLDIRTGGGNREAGSTSFLPLLLCTHNQQASVSPAGKEQSKSRCVHVWACVCVWSVAGVWPSLSGLLPGSPVWVSCCLGIVAMLQGCSHSGLCVWVSGCPCLCVRHGDCRDQCFHLWHISSASRSPIDQRQGFRLVQGTGLRTSVRGTKLASQVCAEGQQEGGCARTQSWRLKISSDLRKGVHVRPSVCWVA